LSGKYPTLSSDINNGAPGQTVRPLVHWVTQSLLLFSPVSPASANKVLKNMNIL
jgi:hypothetical protein